MEIIYRVKELGDLLKKHYVSAQFVYFHSKCHPSKPVWCKYHSDGFIIIECSECEKEIIKNSGFGFTGHCDRTGENVIDTDGILDRYSECGGEG